MSNVIERATALRRAREGTGLPLTEAANSLGVTRATLSVYETGRRPPTRERRDEIVRRLALGRPKAGELSPRFMVAFRLLGLRYLADSRGRVLDVGDLDTAARVADVLDGYQLEQVVVVPSWESYRNELPVPDGFRPIDATSDREIAPVVAECLQAIASNAPRWLCALTDKEIRSNA